MKLLLFSDVHCDLAAVGHLVDAARSVDVVVGAGDFATMRRGLDSTIRALAEIDKPAVLVPGNGESDEELHAAISVWPTAVALHGSGATIEGLPFFGLGAGVPVTPFGSWSFDLDEQQAAALLQPCPPGAILVTHSPPLGTLDVDASGQHLGSQSIRDCILARQPRLVVCGHVHNCAGRHDRVGDVPVVNAGPSGVLWDIDVGEVSS